LQPRTRLAQQQSVSEAHEAVLSVRAEGETWRAERNKDKSGDVLSGKLAKKIESIEAQLSTKNCFFSRRRFWRRHNLGAGRPRAVISAR
jgi:hypothetical protein